MNRRELLYKEKEYALKDLFQSIWNNFIKLREEILRLFEEYANNPSDELKKTIINLCNVGIEQVSDNYYLSHFINIDPITDHKYKYCCEEIKEEFDRIVLQLSEVKENNK